MKDIRQHILTHSEIDRQQWSRLVRTSETGTWFQSPEAYDFFTSLPELMKAFAYGVEYDGGLRAVCVGYVTNEKNPLKHFFTRRAIIIGGVAIADNCAKEDVSVLLNAVRTHIQSKTIYIETRNLNDFSPWKGAFESAGFAYRKHLNFHVNASLDNLSDNRKRQLKKSDAIVTESASEAEILEWYRVLAELYRTKVKTPLWPVEFFLRAWQNHIATFLLVKHEGRIIGGSMVVKDARAVYEWYECGLNADYKEQSPSVVATYAGILLARQSACPLYDMMGAGEPGVPYGVRDFKAEFGGTLVEHGRFLCVCKPYLFKLGTWVVKHKKKTIHLRQI